MSALTVAIASVGAVGVSAAVANLVLATQALRRRARRLARTSKRVSGINVTFADGHTQAISVTPATTHAVENVMAAAGSGQMRGDRTKNAPTPNRPARARR